MRVHTNYPSLAAAAGLCALAACGGGDQAAPLKPASVTPPVTSQPAVDTAETIIDRHLAAFGAADLPGLLADYADDVVFVTPMGTIKGKDGLSPVFEGLFAEFAKPGATFKLDKKLVSGNLAYITWSAETADNVYELGTDTFVIANGKIARQTFAGKITPKAPASPAAALVPPANGPTSEVLAHHLGAFGQGNLDEILADYTDTSVFLSQMGQVTGRQGLSPVFQGLFAEFAKPGATFEMHAMIVEDDLALIVWSAETADNRYEWATDTFVIRDGTISYQTLAAKVTPKR